MSKIFLLSLIFAVSGFLKFWRGEELFFWNVDQDLISLVVRRIIEDGRPQLIGFPIPGGIYLGPIFYYLASAVYLFVGMNPSLIFIPSAILALITTYLVWRVGKEIFEDSTTGLFAAIIYAFSSLANIYSHSLSGLNFAPLLALLVYLQLYRSLKIKKVNNLIFLTALLVISAQIEGSTISLILLIILVFLIFRVKIKKLQIFKLTAVFMMFHIPLLIFDLRHNFFLAHSIIDFWGRLSKGGNFNLDILSGVISVLPNTMARTIMISGVNDISRQILDCGNFVTSRLSEISPFTYLFAVVTLGFFIFSQIFKKRIIWGEKIIFIHLIVLLFGLFAYNLFLPGYIHEWVLVIFLPAISFIYAILLSKFFKSGVLQKNLVVLFLIFFVAINVKGTLDSTNKFGLRNRIDATVESLKLIGNRDYYLVSLGSCYAQGYIYLFDHFGKKPSYVEGLIFDPAYFQQEIKPDLGVILVNPLEGESEYLEKYDIYKSRALVSRKVGDIEIIIVEDR